MPRFLGKSNLSAQTRNKHDFLNRKKKAGNARGQEILGRQQFLFSIWLNWRKWILKCQGWHESVKIKREKINGKSKKQSSKKTNRRRIR